MNRFDWQSSPDFWGAPGRENLLMRLWPIAVLVLFVLLLIICGQARAADYATTAGARPYLCPSQWAAEEASHGDPWAVRAGCQRVGRPIILKVGECVDGSVRVVDEGSMAVPRSDPYWVWAFDTFGPRWMGEHCLGMRY